MAYNKAVERADGPMRRRATRRRKKVCVFLWKRQC